MDINRGNKLEARSSIVLSFAMSFGFVALAGVNESVVRTPMPEIGFIGEEQEFPGPKEAPGVTIIPPRHKPGFKNHSRAFM